MAKHRLQQLILEMVPEAIAILRASFSQAAAVIYCVDLEPPEIEISQDHTRIAAEME
jgi:hypothetical protein